MGVLVLAAVVVVALPPSLLTRFLPPQMHAEDLSGSLWHGSAGRVTLMGRDVGALEWRLHPLSLLTLSLAVDLHWVKVSCVIDGSVTLKRNAFTAHAIKGSGAIEDLRELGVAPGWRGHVTLALSEVRGDFSKVDSAVGTLALSQVSSTGIAQGTELGSYELTLGPHSVGTEGRLEAALHDTGGPVELQAALSYTPGATGILTGTLKERADAPAALRDQIASLAQMRPRDAQGRIPVDLEFSL